MEVVKSVVDTVDIMDAKSWYPAAVELAARRTSRFWMTLQKLSAEQ